MDAKHRHGPGLHREHARTLRGIRTHGYATPSSFPESWIAWRKDCRTWPACAAEWNPTNLYLRRGEAGLLLAVEARMLDQSPRPQSRSNHESMVVIRKAN
ncbi:hypothetical protein V2G26_006594 [Clonostachys chloroleuca]